MSGVVFMDKVILREEKVRRVQHSVSIPVPIKSMIKIPLQTYTFDSFLTSISCRADQQRSICMEGTSQGGELQLERLKAHGILLIDALGYHL